MKRILGIYILSFMQIFPSCYQKAEPETYLIPSNFTGRVNILFNKKEGAAKKYENDRRVYEIPFNGILVTQFKTNDGFTNREYYSTDNEGKRSPLEIFKYEHNKDGTLKWIVRDKNEKGIFLDGTSGQYGNTDDPQGAQYQEFIVSNYTDLDSFYTKEYQNNFDRKLEKITGLKLTLK
jgi:hypothetical protein